MQADIEEIIAGKISTAELDADQITTGKISAEYLELDDYATKSSVESAIELAENGIKAYVTKTTMDNTLDDYATKSSVESAIELAEGGINAYVTKTTMNNTISSSLSLYVKKTDNSQIISMINASANVITLNSNRLIINSDKFTLTADGSVEATDIKLKNSNGNYFVDIDAGIITVAGSGIFVQETVHDFPIMNFKGWDHYYALCARCTFDEHPDGSYDWLPYQLVFRQSDYSGL